MIPIKSTLTIEGRTLTVLPALIDPHVHFRVPGGEYKEDWISASRAAINGGVTTVCEMPNNTPPCTSYERLMAKKALIDAQLKESGIPLHYHLYFGADKSGLSEISAVASQVCGLKIFMGCSTGGLVIDTDDALEEAFQEAKKAKMLVAVHAEDEATLAKKREAFKNSSNPADHMLMRPREAAVIATSKAIAMAEKYGVRLYVLHISTKEELELIRAAKKRGIPVFAETTTHHLFLSEKDYQTLGTRVQMNPPIRTLEDQAALWQAIQDGTIDTIGTDHAPHTLEEKMRPFGQAPSGIPGVETLLPLLLDAVSRGKLTLDRLISLTRTNSEKLFHLPTNSDLVLVDLEREERVEEGKLYSKCGWSPYAGWKLKGWPLYTVLNGQVFATSRGAAEGQRQVEAYLRAHRVNNVGESR